MYSYCLLQRRSDLFAPSGSASWQHARSGMFQALILEHHDTIGSRQVKKFHSRKIADDDNASGKRSMQESQTMLMTQLNRKITSWQTGPTKAVTAERRAQQGVADVSQEKKKSSLIRVPHIKKRNRKGRQCKITC